MDRTSVARATRCVLRAWPMVLATASLVGCGAPEDGDGDSIGGAVQPVISGTDDRKEVYAHESAWMRSYAEQATAALVDSDRVSVNPTTGAVTLTADTLGSVRGLCVDEPFRDQPALAVCTATLIDDDLVLTAGHCVTNAALPCADMRFLFDFHYTASGVRAPLSAQEVFSCRRVVLSQSPPAPGAGPDYAIVQLDRRATPRFQPAPVRRARGPLERGLHVKSVSFPDGIPAKIEYEGVVTTVNYGPNYFGASLDVFEGSSGAGIFEGDGFTLAGVLSAAAAHYVSSGACNVRAVCSTQDCETAAVQYAGPALDALCAMPTESHPRLCSTVAPANDRCGDAENIELRFGRQQTFSGSTANGTNEFTAPCGSGTNRSPDVFYKFTPTVPTIVYADAYTSDFPAVVYLRDGCASTASRIQCSASSCGLDKGQIATVVQPGRTYYLAVVGRGGTSGRYNLHVQFLPASDRALALRPADVTTAPPVPLRAGSFSGIVTGDTTGYASRAAGTCGGASGDHAYYFTTCPDFRGGSVRAFTTGLATWDTVIHSRQGHSPTTGCNDNSSGAVTTSVLSATAAPGAGLQALYLDGNAGHSGPYSMRYAVAAP